MDQSRQTKGSMTSIIKLQPTEGCTRWDKKRNRKWLGLWMLWSKPILSCPHHINSQPAIWFGQKRESSDKDFTRIITLLDRIMTWCNMEVLFHLKMMFIFGLEKRSKMDWRYSRGFIIHLELWFHWQLCSCRRCLWWEFKFENPQLHWISKYDSWSSCQSRILNTMTWLWSWTRSHNLILI